MTTDRQKARRKQVHAAVKSVLEKRLLELGFERTRTREGRRTWSDVGKYFGFGRRRDGFVELVGVYWDKYGRPFFRLDFKRYLEVEGALPHHFHFQLGGVLPKPDPMERVFGSMRGWFGERQSLRSAIEQALRGLDELEAFFRTNSRGDQLYLSQSGDGQPVLGPSAPLEALLILMGPLIILVQAIEAVLDERRDRTPGR